MSSNKKLSYNERGRLGYLASKDSHQKARVSRHADYYKNPKLCKNCGKPIPFEKRTSSTFCSRSCSCTYNNLHRPAIMRVCNTCGKQFEARSGFAHYCSACVGANHICIDSSHAGTTRRKTANCVNCGKEFDLVYAGKKYCSIECSARHRNKELYNKIVQYVEERGEFPTCGGSVVNGETNRNRVRIYLENKYGHKCSICGITEWRGQPVPLVVDHIDGNSRNHKVDNFRLICNNCDAQLPTYKAKNKGNGRKYRRVNNTVDND